MDEVKKFSLEKAVELVVNTTGEDEPAKNIRDDVIKAAREMEDFLEPKDEGDSPESVSQSVGAYQDSEIVTDPNSFIGVRPRRP